jgi:WD40 repeat protein
MYSSLFDHSILKFYQVLFFFAVASLWLGIPQTVSADEFDYIGEVQGYLAKRALNSDGSRLVTTLRSGTFRAWNTRTLDSYAPWSRNSQDATSWMSRDGTALIRVYAEEVRNYDVATSAVTSVSPLCKGCQSQYVSVSEDGKLFATVRSAGERDDVVIYKLGSPAPERALRHPGRVSGIWFDPTGKYLLSHGFDNQFPYRVWEVGSGREIIPAIANNDPDYYAGNVEAEFMRSGTRLLVPRANGYDIIDFTTGKVLAGGRVGEKWNTMDVSCDPVGSRVALVTRAGLHESKDEFGPAQVFDSKTGKLIATLRKGPVYCTLLPISNLALCKPLRGDGEDPPEIWDVSRQVRVQSLSLKNGEHWRDVAVSEDGRVIAVETDQGTTMLWRVHDAK